MKLIINATILTMDEQFTVYTNGFIAIENDKIIALGDGSYAQYSVQATEIFDAKGKIVSPGLVNTHVHLSQQMGRGLADDVDLLTWLRDRIWPYESTLTTEENYISALACCTEMIKSGVTTFLEAGGQHLPSMVKAVTESGMRASLAVSVTDTGIGLPETWVKPTDEWIDIQEDFIKKYNHANDDRIHVWANIRTIFNATEPLIEKTFALAERHDVGVHMHVQEIKEEVDFTIEKFGTTTLGLIERLGCLNDRLLAVHSVWFNEEDISRVVRNNVKISHNPAAAMRLLGFSPVPKLLSLGVPVSIGTDGAPANNRMDMIDEMHLTALIHKGRTLDPLVVDAPTVMRMATMNGAICARREHEIGSLEVGKKADLIVVNLCDIGSYPVYNPVSNFVYANHSRNVEASMCNGEWIMKNRTVLGINEVNLLSEMKIMADIIGKRVLGR